MDVPDDFKALPSIDAKRGGIARAYQHADSGAAALFAKSDGRSKRRVSEAFSLTAGMNAEACEIKRMRAGVRVGEHGKLAGLAA